MRCSARRSISPIKCVTWPTRASIRPSRRFEQFLEATQQAVAKAEGSARSVQEGAADLNRQAMAYMEENIGASFDFVQRLVQRRTVEEVAALQQEFVRKQMAGRRRAGEDPSAR